MEEREAVFQFLIGKMKTQNMVLKVLCQNPFQFLIGKMKTLAKPYKIPVFIRSGFNSS